MNAAFLLFASLMFLALTLVRPMTKPMLVLGLLLAFLTLLFKSC